ncbi:fibrous sheath CABYR-binding protein [Drosophila sechellia]|uniref:GM24003 n=1 Tax=Drosophila sechellia TaxID=7238 RepID=B4HHG1_DROSE|nr:fibrous sheath CABYR-binding protein [Drosophila sechellia]EDW42500.1 GM24003 [Drosophila sechellia]
MNYLIQRGKMRQQAINVPEGLPELLSDVTREVLRCQPKKECLCQFIIDYLHSVIVTREKAMVAKTILDRSLRQVDSIISDLCVCDLSKEKSELMGQVLEDCFRNFLEKRRCEMRRGKQAINFEDVDILEELLQKCKFTDEELVMSRPAIESAYKRFVDAYMSAERGADGTELLYQYFRDRELKRINEATRNQAAITIQAAWRGYWVRLQFPQEVCVCVCAAEKEDDGEEQRRQHAASVLQRFFRKVMLRVATKPIVDPCAEPTEPTEMGASSSPDTAKDGYDDVTLSTVPTTAAITAGPTPMPTAPGTVPPSAQGTAPATARTSATALAEPEAHDEAAEAQPAEEAPAAEAPADEAAPPSAEEAAPPPAEEAAPEAAEEPAPAPPPEEAAAPPPPAEEPAPAEEAAPPAEEAPAEEAPAAE